MNREQRRLLKEGFRDLRRRLPDLDRAYRRQRIMRWARRGFLSLAILAAGVVVLRSMGIWRVWDMPGDYGHDPDPHAKVAEPATAQAQPSSRPAFTPVGAELRPNGPVRVETR